MIACAAMAACGVQFTEECLARVHALSRIAAPQLPTIFRGTTCFVDWHVDAVDRAALAGLQTYQFRGVTRRFRFRQPNSNLIAGVDRRLRRRPLRPAARRNCYAGRAD